MNNRKIPVVPARNSLLILGILWMLAGTPVPASDAPEITVFKTPTCGCCGKWVKHLEANGFDVTTKEMDDLSAIKAQNKIKPGLASCHTALVDGYVVEGHVPADVIFRLLKERPAVAGITVPGMPAGSPGMEMGVIQPYEVLTFDADGNTTVFATRGLETAPNKTQE
jgi:hypothetical protein